VGCTPYGCSLIVGNDTVYARDGETDSITCGFGEDTVIADPKDVVDSSCEHVDRGAPPPPTGGGTPAAPTPVKVVLALAGHPRAAAALRAGLRVRLTGPPR
jgi:hypothetical protein